MVQVSEGHGGKSGGEINKYKPMHVLIKFKQILTKSKLVGDS